MKYHLSNRQAKELTDGKVLRIAMPHPPEEVPDVSQWTRQHLDMPAGTLLHVAEKVRLTVNPLFKPDTGIASMLGCILGDQTDGEAAWTVEIECIVAEISQRHTGRSRYPTQWPARVTLDNGKTIP